MGPTLILAMAAWLALGGSGGVAHEAPSGSVRTADESIEVFSDDGDLIERYTLNEKGEKTGPFETFGPGGSVMVQGAYRKGKLHGKLEEFTETGELLRETMYSGGIRNGFCREYVEDFCCLKSSYKNGVLHGRWERFDPERDHSITASYKRGVLSGRYTETRNSGKWSRAANYKDGELNGAAKISLGKKTVSKRIWEKGRLLDIDGVVPFPVALGDLAAELAEASVVPNIEAGDEKSPDRMAALARLRTYRAACGLPWRHVRLDAALNDLCDAASEVSQGNGKLSHSPEKPAGMDEARFRQGFEGASNSNLSSGPMVGSVDSYMDDSDASNIDRVGHRRWCLNPSMGVTAFGQAGRWSAMWAVESSGPSPGKRKTVLFPPAGFVPVDLFGPRHAWSLHAIDGRLPSTAEAAVIRVMRLDEYYQEVGEPLELDWKSLSTEGFGGSPCMIFRPVGVEVKPGVRYGVTIQWTKGKQPDHRYYVEFVGRQEAPPK